MVMHGNHAFGGVYEVGMGAKRIGFAAGAVVMGGIGIRNNLL